MKHFLIFVNGMTPNFDSHDWKAEYLQFWQGVLKERPSLGATLDESSLVFVQWGHPKSSDETGIKSELQKAQKYIWESQAKPKSWFTRTLDWISSGLGYSQKAKLNHFLTGLGDVLWANTSRGKKYIRMDFLEAMMEAGIVANEPTQLHLISHSYGVTLCFDFIRDLFSNESIDEEERGGEMTGDYKRYWESLRRAVGASQLKLGSFAGMASQLPMSITRHPRMLTSLANRSRIDLQCMGLATDETKTKVKFFYDPEDLLGFQSAPLFSESIALKDIRVNTGLLPIKAHNGYWFNSTVHKEYAQLLDENLGV